MSDDIKNEPLEIKPSCDFAMVDRYIGNFKAKEFSLEVISYIRLDVARRQISGYWKDDSVSKVLIHIQGMIVQSLSVAQARFVGHKTLPEVKAAVSKIKSDTRKAVKVTGNTRIKAFNTEAEIIDSIFTAIVLPLLDRVEASQQSNVVHFADIYSMSDWYLYATSPGKFKEVSHSLTVTFKLSTRKWVYEITHAKDTPLTNHILSPDGRPVYNDPETMMFLLLLKTSVYLARLQILQYFIDEIDKDDYLSNKAAHLAAIVDGDPRDYAIIADSLDKLYSSPYNSNQDTLDGIKKAPEFINSILRVNQKELNKIMALYDATREVI